MTVWEYYKAIYPFRHIVLISICNVLSNAVTQTMMARPYYAADNGVQVTTGQKHR